jgi:hypothetical protein
MYPGNPTSERKCSFMVDSLREAIAGIEQLVIKILEELPQDVQEEIAIQLKASLDELSSELQKEGMDWDTILHGEEGNQFIDAIRSALAPQVPAESIPEARVIADDNPPPQKEHRRFRLFGKKER